MRIKQSTDKVGERNDTAIGIILSEPALQEGNRHLDGIKRLHQLRSNGMGREEAVQAVLQLYPHGSGTHRPIDRNEFYRAYDGAADLPLEPWATSRRELGHYRRDSYSLERNGEKLTFKLSDIPSGELPKGREIKPIDFLRLAFKPGELVCINNETAERGGKETIVGHGNFRTIEEWGERFTDYGENMLDGSVGCWIRINPFKTGTTEGDDKSVSDYRNLLVEFDSRPKSEQWKIYKESDLPIRYVIDSGGDSLHAWIAVNAKTAGEFKERQQAVYGYLSEYLDDRGNKNPSRYSRLPGVERREKGAYQALIAENIGATSWSEWEESVSDDGLPEFVDLANLFETDIPEPKHVIKDCIRKGEVGSLVGATKTNKTWTTMELALEVIRGGKFLKWEANRGRVCYVDTELPDFVFKDRMQKIAAAKNIEVDKGDIDNLLLRGSGITSIDKLAPALIKRLKGKEYDLIIIDSIYFLLGDREENSNEDIASLGSVLQKIAKETGAAIIFTHHFSKGSQIGKRGIEKSSGAGSWGRVVDMCLAVDHHSEEFHYNFEPEFRSFAPKNAFVARRAGAIWELVDRAKVEHKKASAEKGALNDVLDILANECGGEASPLEWFEACKARLPIGSRKTFDARKDKAIDAKLIEQSGSTKNTLCRLLAVKDPTTGHYRVRASQIVNDGGNFTYEQE
jgi:RecA-family ATPase